MHATRFFVALIALTFAIAAQADVTPHPLFTSHGVLQRDMPVPVWGWADKGEKVTVTFAGQTKTATTGDDGKWMVKLDSMAASTEGRILTIEGSNKVEVKDVLVGEVWVCSGQSNMGWSVTRSNGADEEIATAKYPLIRLLTTPQTSGDKPQTTFRGQWAVCSPQTIPNFSAVGYSFGRHLHHELKVPIGLINSSWGGTRVEAWTRLAVLEKTPQAKELLGWWNEQIKAYDPAAAKARAEKIMARWKEQAAKAKAAGKKALRRPRLAGDPAQDRHRPGNLYNHKIAPLIPYAIRGAIWYQGESNVSRAYQYRVLFPTMINNWRSDWGQGDFPFYFVQLAPFRYGRADPAACAELWEAQLMTLKNVKNTGMAVTMDVGNPKDIHPKNKQAVGKRLALWALAKDYGKDVIFSGPIYKAVEFKDGKALVSFDHVPVALTTNDSQPPTHFEIAGEDKKFHPAQTKLVGDKVLAWSDQVTKPVAVRYAWQDDAEPTLQNTAALPASPFRTDDWPAVTRDKKTP